ncbi:RNA exonuclease 1 homolog [Hyposmocoma kahamanoa]|uniref:RNA exonuclease 1 homolog n=1 Tax=Hyposmocoma kahamanoa TaxID=1477025 RepID=UPI000E6D7CD8|nr:RNA exonuclease 1 homolog [Hyposmocoma kahamanoa]
MLPSTGYFKGINCPFYDSGLCERPYCHFRHAKKDSVLNPSNDGIESGAILQKLVSAAVQKVLQQNEGLATATSTPAVPTEGTTDISKINNVVVQSKVTYNPTPIAQLNKINNASFVDVDDLNEQRKKHIPVPYTPRKPASVPIKRPTETNGSTKPFIYIPPPVKYTPGCAEAIELDPYTPKGATECNEKYLPGIEKEIQEYKPKESQSLNKRNYVPSDRNVNKKKILEYKPTKVSSSNEIPSVTYQPTPRFLAPCFSSDEDEPDVKKVKIANDINGLDDLGPEFDILDQILHEEKQHQNSNSDLNSELDVTTQEQSSKPEPTPSDSVKPDGIKSTESSSPKDAKKSEHHKKHKSSSSRKENRKSHEKSKSDKDKDKSNKDRTHNHEQSDKKTKEPSHKSHKSASRDKSKEKVDKKDKSSKKDKPSSRSSKHSDLKSSKTEKHSKHSSSSKNKDKKSDHYRHSREDKKMKKKDKSVIDELNHDSNFADNTQFDQRDEGLYNISSESDEDAIALECKRIFEEYVPAEKKVVEESCDLSLEDNTNTEYVSAKKRISRTSDTKVKVLPRPSLKPDYKVNAAQTMAERLTKVREFHASQNTGTSISETASLKTHTEPPKTFTPHSSNSKIRIAHVPYASTLMSAKRGIPPPNMKKEEPTTSSTMAQTIKKGVQRVAHIPNEKFIDRPGVLEPLASKIAANIRSTYLNMMIDECLKIYLSATDAYARAQHEELATSKKCSTVQIYKNSAVLTVSRLRKELQECNGVKKSGSECSALQKIPQSISGHTSQAGSWSIENKNRRVIDNVEFVGAKFYNNIKKWVLSEEQLKENGFPLPHSSGEKGRAIIYGQNKQKPPKGFIRTCCRCKKDYTIDKKGFPAVKEECIYHPNNKYRVRGEIKYQCCSQDGSSDGCCIAPCHVYEYVDYENLKGFVRTLPPEREMDDYAVYSLDCEMCYTTHGLDLTRVTVINSACKVVFESLIKPLHPIIDYNTRYSGITEEQMANVKTTLLDVQATILTMFNSKTILIGHSLESDFKALKLIHGSVIDTSVLFPHKMGPPYKRALRNLSSEYLKKIIQNSVDGHDSAEDARACMELIIFKLKEDLKTR